MSLPPQVIQLPPTVTVPHWQKKREWWINEDNKTICRWANYLHISTHASILHAQMEFPTRQTATSTEISRLSLNSHGSQLIFCSKMFHQTFDIQQPEWDRLQTQARQRQMWQIGNIMVVQWPIPNTSACKIQFSRWKQKCNSLSTDWPKYIFDKWGLVLIRSTEDKWWVKSPPLSNWMIHPNQWIDPYHFLLWYLSLAKVWYLHLDHFEEHYVLI